MPETTLLITVTASVVLLKDNKILLVQEDKIKNRNLWNLPGGRFELHEPVMDCALRECLEETGYKAQLTSLLGLYKYVANGKYDLIRYVFLAEIIGEQTTYWTHEIKAHRWATLDEMDKIKDNEWLAPNCIRAIIKDLRTSKFFPLDVVKWC